MKKSKMIEIMNEFMTTMPIPYDNMGRDLLMEMEAAGMLPPCVEVVDERDWEGIIRHKYIWEPEDENS